MIAIEPRRRFQPAASLCLLALVASARPGLASTLTFTAVHANYQPGAAASATITDTVTDTVRWDLTKVLQRTVLAGGEDVGGVEAELLRSVEIAQSKQARSLELRATMSLARLWISQHRLEEAKSHLSALYAWFTEGFDTPDLQAARALLAQL